MGLFLFAIALIAADDGPVLKKWTVGGQEREALVVAPTKTIDEAAGHPVIFAFHGHGGSMRNTHRAWALHKLWPEALVVYPQGLPTPGKFDPGGQRPGWQNRPGQQDDRDLKFVDAIWESLGSEYKLDPKRVFATGHSNGAGFTYCLWYARPDRFTAFAPSAASPRIPVGKALPPRPVLHIAGKNDKTVPFADQEKTIAGVKTNNGCDEKGREWAPGCLKYESTKGAPVVIMIHEGDHKYDADAPARIVRFFQEAVSPP